MSVVFETDQVNKMVTSMISELHRDLNSTSDASGVQLAIAKRMATWAEQGRIHDYETTRIPNLEVLDVFFSANVGIRMTPAHSRNFRVTLRKVADGKED